jgi:ribonuclease E
MTDPNDDDTWGELARELEIDKPAAEPPSPTGEAVAEDVGEFEDAGLVEAEPGAAEGEFDAEDAEGEPGEGGPGEGPPGTGRKRRRRRRRRKKGGPAGQPGSEAAEGAEPVAAEPEADDAEPVERPQPVVRARAEAEVEADDDEAEEIEPAAVPLAAEEDTGSEVLRELIASWNVPSWDDIVSGLYRPER